MKESTNKKISVLDTTLRDGDQSPGLSFSIREKLRMAGILDRLGVDIIEAGFPASSKADFESVRETAAVVSRAAVSAFARSLSSDIETAARALEKARRRIMHLSIATSPLHREYKLKLSRGQIIDKAAAAVKFAVPLSDIVEIGAEDAARTERDFLTEFCIAMTQSGASVVNISDTVGFAQPDEFAELIRHLKINVPAFADDTARISVHCHDDLGCAAANTLAAIRAGAAQIETTLCGIGERAGNAALEEIAAALIVRSDYYNAALALDTKYFAHAFRELSAITGSPVQQWKCVSGRNSFAHASGIHQDGIIANRETYAVVPGADFGREPFRFTLTRHSGVRGFIHAVKRIAGIDMADDEAKELFSVLKNRSDAEKIITATELIRFLNETKKISSEVWSVSAYRHICGAERRCTIGAECISNTGSSVLVRLPHPPDIKKLYETMDALFGQKTDVIEYAETRSGTADFAAVRFFLNAKAGGEEYFCEHTGDDSSRLVIEAYFDILNTRRAKGVKS